VACRVQVWRRRTCAAPGRLRLTLVGPRMRWKVAPDRRCRGASAVAAQHPSATASRSSSSGRTPRAPGDRSAVGARKSPAGCPAGGPAGGPFGRRRSTGSRAGAPAGGPTGDVDDLRLSRMLSGNLSDSRIGRGITRRRGGASRASGRPQLAPAIRRCAVRRSCRPSARLPASADSRGSQGRTLEIGPAAWGGSSRRQGPKRWGNGLRPSRAASFVVAGDVTYPGPPLSERSSRSPRNSQLQMPPSTAGRLLGKPGRSSRSRRSGTADPARTH
jgi:hypothetical protein